MTKLDLMIYLFIASFLLIGLFALTCRIIPGLFTSLAVFTTWILVSLSLTAGLYFVVGPLVGGYAYINKYIGHEPGSGYTHYPWEKIHACQAKGESHQTCVDRFKYSTK